MVLDEVTRHIPLDAFVCFSSVAGVWGSGMQAAYAAANAFHQAGGPEVSASYGGSLGLARQLVAGAPADVFISADEPSMDAAAGGEAVKAETRSVDDVFGNWRVLRELDKPLCSLTLTKEASGADNYKVIVRPGCDATISAFAPTTWRLDRDQIVLSGRGGNWRFAESDPSTWEKMPLSTDPLLLMKQ